MLLTGKLEYTRTICHCKIAGIKIAKITQQYKTNSFDAMYSVFNDNIILKLHTFCPSLKNLYCKKKRP